MNYVNDPFIISQNEKMLAVNSAVEVDLTGQVCSDSIGTYIYSGFGGQVDFIRGAARSKGGKPVIAVSSTAKGGDLSRIVPMLKPGAGVVTSRADVHYVVTEFGTANIFGKNLRERAEALIKIAHPDFRDELEKQAKEKPPYLRRTPTTLEKERALFGGLVSFTPGSRPWGVDPGESPLVLAKKRVWYGGEPPGVELSILGSNFPERAVHLELQTGNE